VDALGRGDKAALAGCFHADARLHVLDGATTPAAWLESLQRLRAAIPDLKIGLDEVLVDGERASVRTTWRGTPRGRARSRAPRRKSFDVAVVESFRLEDGNIREKWGGHEVEGLLRQNAALSAATMGSRAFLAVVAVLTIGLGVASLHDTSSPVLAVTETVLASAAGPITRVLAGMGIAVLAWAIARPRDGARIAVAVPGAILLATLAIAAWGRADEHAAVTLGQRVNQAWAALEYVQSVAKVGLYAASLAACLAGLAYAFRARAASGSPALTVPAVLVPFAIVPATLFAIWWAAQRSHEPHTLVLMATLAGVTALASATALGGLWGDEEATTRDALAATACSITAILLGMAAVRVEVWVGVTGMEPRVVDALFTELPVDRRHALKEASGYLAPIVVAALLGTRWRAAAARAALVEVGGPLLAALVGIAGLDLAMGKAASTVSPARFVSSLAPVEDAVAPVKECDNLPLKAVLRAGGGRMTLPDGPAGDIGDAFYRIDRLDPDDDLWLSLDADAAPFAEAGAVLAAAGQLRGPRVIGTMASMPPRGCAVVVVGHGADGSVSCTDPIALGVEGCKVRASTEFEHILRVRQRADRTVALSVRVSPDKEVPERTGTLDQLTTIARDGWRAHGSHNAAFDSKLDALELEIEPAVSQRDVLAAIGALRAVTRDAYRNGIVRTVPAFNLSIALLSDDAR
jgi:predicted ester cyclase